MDGQHVPVLLQEVIDNLQPRPGQHFIDCTLGAGGHARAILERTAPDGQLLGIDLDEQAQATAAKAIGPAWSRVTCVRDSFANLKQIYNEQFSLLQISGILLDLGISSLELADKDRGFSFQIDGPLDMRFDTRQSLTAADIINSWPFEKLRKVIQEYGQEPLANEIANQIIIARQHGPITKTKSLVEAILLAFRNKLQSQREVPWIGGIHPATRTFQAIRLAVNGELENLQSVLPQAVELLTPGGRLAVISFHSLEDTIVKRYFKQEIRDCICPPEIPVCQCGHQASLRLVTRRPVRPSEAEVRHNQRSRSALLRVVEKINKEKK